jgi:CDP-glycerol glycerophosphotransferase (TagB/SpsB family)
MANVRHNVAVEGLGGMLGKQLFFKKDKAGRTIISYKPTFDENRTFSPAQQTQQEAFREAVAYGKSAKDNPV